MFSRNVFRNTWLLIMRIYARKQWHGVETIRIPYTIGDGVALSVARGGTMTANTNAVSYTHLDVYKRQE